MIKHDFLELSYEKIGFLVNRDQFISSIYLEDDGDVTEYNEERLFTFNLDKSLNEEFGFPVSETLRLALICDTANYTDYTKKRFKTMLKDKPELSERYLSLKIGSQAEINSIPFNEIKLIPGKMNRFQLRRGILGMRFKREDYPQFLIDIERFVFNSLFKERLLD